jgi:IS605 OrfB family transposase
MTLIYPTLLFSANNIDSHSWFDIKYRPNYANNKKKKKFKIKTNFINTFVINLQLNQRQKTIIKFWLDSCIIVYNVTNGYIKNNLTQNNFFDIVNFYKLRKLLRPQLDEICSLYNLPRHCADYSVKHCVDMYKASQSSHKFIDKFNIHNLSFLRRRKNLIIEPGNISSTKNSFYVKLLGPIISNLPLNLIKQNSVLQYDTIKKTFKLIVPVNNELNTVIKRHEKCGIDIGVRTFLTTYSEDSSYEIGSNCCEIIDRYNKRLDSRRSSCDQKIISDKKRSKIYAKYSDKLKNKISDMHNKVASMLVHNYNEIIIGNISIKKMLSNISSNLFDVVKRRLVALSHYRFRMKLKTMANKYGNKIVEVDEYLTSKICSECGYKHKNLGSNKIYHCEICNLTIDRDINAAINIYKNENLRV